MNPSLYIYKKDVIPKSYTRCNLNPSLSLYNKWNWLRLCLVHVKYFPKNIYFPKMLFSGKENIFKCLVAFQKMFRKIFSSVWLCSWKYHRKHIFYLLLTFSWLPNEYIISFIPQYKNTNNTQKKNHQIWSHFLGCQINI